MRTVRFIDDGYLALMSVRFLFGDIDGFVVETMSSLLRCCNNANGSALAQSQGEAAVNSESKGEKSRRWVGESDMNDGD